MTRKLSEIGRRKMNVVSNFNFPNIESNTVALTLRSVDIGAGAQTGFFHTFVNLNLINMP